ncbi:nuclear transport factor 2 family protein [Mucilaginibacter sp. HMF5004]|uniref:YybH family protein n=1 Tax=Mucilaginibacter rivuli TaxID=2857527 RepID=UPI001C5D5492|nr:nuclear transport factor 2 family protein [Mucilaginibacter rivuli]MBW4891188.1 nuclear transport factor 2 family protein [Mucilaginibacter rivuli]
MKKVIAAIVFSILFSGVVLAQKAAEVQTVVAAEEAFNKAVAKKGIKEGFLSAIDDDAIVFRPNAVSAKEFYTRIDKQPGNLSWVPKFGRISANGDLAFTAGPYIYQNSAADTDKVYGHYVSVWRTDANGKLKLLIDLGVQHPEPEQPEIIDLKDPTGKVLPPSKDPFLAKKLIMGTDDMFNHSLDISALATYKEFFSPEAHYYFPGFEPLIGTDKIMKFINNQAISISAKTSSVGRAASNDLAYSYGTAIIKKGGISSNYNYVRIWELDASHKWNILLEVFSAVEK